MTEPIGDITSHRIDWPKVNKSEIEANDAYAQTHARMQMCGEVLMQQAEEKGVDINREDVQILIAMMAEVLYAEAHELGHIRQWQKLKPIRGVVRKPHNQQNWDEEDKEILLGYLTDQDEANAHGFAVRYLKAKEKDPNAGEFWKQLYFRKIIGRQMERMGVATIFRDGLKAQKLIQERDQLIESDPQGAARLHRQAVIIATRLQTYNQRLDKMHTRLGSIAPDPTQT